MSKILLDYVFPITVTEAIAQASTAFLKQACIVCKSGGEAEGVAGGLYTITNPATAGDYVGAGAVAEVQELFNAGMSKVFILIAADLNLTTYLATHTGKFFTLIISSDFTGEDVETGEQVTVEEVKAELKIQDILFRAKTAGVGGNAITINYDGGGTAGDESVGVVGNAITVTIEDGVSTAQEIANAIENEVAADALVDCIVDSGDETDPQAVFGAAVALAGGVDEETDEGAGLAVGTFDGVIGVATTDAELAQEQAAISKRSGWFKKNTTGSKNMAFAFGKLLSNLVGWRNQQYIPMPFNDEIDVLGEATSLFDDKVSFVLNDEEFGNRLALFAAGGKAIVAPYIMKNLRIDLQSRALQWINANQPQYTIKEATLLETRLQEDVINAYIARGDIESGTIEITLVQQNFVANGSIEVPTPNALWRVVNEMVETT